MDNMLILLDEIKDSVINNYAKFPKMINRELKKIVNDYELNAKQVKSINARLKPVLDKIKQQNIDNKTSIVSDIELIISEHLESSREKTVDANFASIDFDFKGFWRGNWHIEHDNAFGWDNAFVVNDLMHGRVLQVMHKGATSCAKITPLNPGGLQFFNAFKDKYEHLILAYSVNFEEGFRFCRGGRLPGLYGGDIISEDQVPNGTNGFLSKIGWTSNGFGELILNLPPVNGQNRWYYTGGGWRFTPGKWHTIQQEIYLNKDSKDGYAKITFDDKKVIFMPDLCFRNSDDVKIKGIAFTNYYGENDPLATCPADTWMEFSCFKISHNL